MKYAFLNIFIFFFLLFISGCMMMDNLAEGVSAQATGGILPIYTEDYTACLIEGINLQSFNEGCWYLQDVKTNGSSDSNVDGSHYRAISILNSSWYYELKSYAKSGIGTLDLNAYSNGHLNLTYRTAAIPNFRIGIGSSDNGGIVTYSYIDIPTNTWISNEFIKMSLPISDFKKAVPDLNLIKMKTLFVIRNTAFTGSGISFDSVYWTVK